jgi:hypothetical protein
MRGAKDLPFDFMPMLWYRLALRRAALKTDWGKQQAARTSF